MKNNLFPINIMLIKKRKHGYLTHRKYMQGRGFVEFIKPTLQNIGSYIYQNKDLIAKPVLGAVGDLAALGLSQGGKAILEHIMQKNSSNINNKNKLDQKGIEILNSIINEPVSNIVGSGIKQF